MKTHWKYWVAIITFVVTMLVHNVFPRYEAKPYPALTGPYAQYYMRIDRWTGTIERKTIDLHEE